MSNHPLRGAERPSPSHRARVRHRQGPRHLAFAIAIALLAHAADGRATQAIPPTENLVVDGGAQTGTPGFHYITDMDGSNDPASTGYGVYALNGGRLTTSDISITTQGRAAHAAVAHANSLIILGGSGSIHTLGDEAAGLWVEDRNAIIVAPSYRVVTEGNAAHGVVVRDSGQVNFDIGSIVTLGGNSLGVSAEDAATTVVASTITTSGDGSHGAMAGTQGGIELTSDTVWTSGGWARGAWADGGQISINSSGITTTGRQSHGISATGSDASVHVADSAISARGEGAAAAHVADGGLVESTRSTLHAFHQAALVVDGHGSWRMLDGSSARGDELLALLTGETSSADILFDRSVGNGDIVRSSGSTRNVDMTLANGSYWAGSTDIVRDMSVASVSSWWLGDDSSVGRLDLSEGFVFLPGYDHGTPGSLRIHGDLVGSGGIVAFQTRADAGGAIAAQSTDRLLVEGNVTTTGVTSLHILPMGAGALTDGNLNGIVEPHEGISVVQVGGHSRMDAFALRGGYVAAGPWQYKLYAFGPGNTDASQNLLEGGPLNWDYRLANAHVCLAGCGGDPGDPDPGDPDPSDPGNPGDPSDPSNPDNPGGILIPEGGGRPLIPEGSRPAVVPQVPSYLVAHTALFAYGLGAIDGLHDRLGEIRENPADTRGEAFVRQTGSRQHYASDVAPVNFGFGFRQSTQMLQVGGSVVSLTEDNDSLRAGWALDRGTTTVTPRAPDGVSQTRYSAQGFSAWVTWQQHDGWYVDAVIGAQRYRGAVDTELRGREVARLRANGRLLSMESGYPFRLGTDWSLEPQVQLSWQTLTFQPLRDKDNVVAAPSDAQQLTTRLGARLRRTTNGRWIPYARVDAVGSTGGRGHAVFATPGDDMILAGGRAGRQLRAGAGLVANPWANVQLYGEGTWRTAIGSHGFRGWAGNLGIRVSF